MRKAGISAVILLLVTAGLLLSQESRNPHGNLKWDCQDCHTLESWKTLRSPMKFNHDETGFHLIGAHASAECIGCHKTPQFNHVGTACIDCHADQHQGQLGQDCENCHTVRDWQGRRDLLEIHAQKGFALTGVHAVADCEACHRKHSAQEYAGTPMDCIGCHGEAFTSATDPNHLVAGFSNDCEKCHHAASGTWSNAIYTHKTYQLVGAHRALDCKSCHVTSYDGTSTDCYSCHASNFAATTDPNHTQSGFDHNCANCHSTTSWTPANFDHNSAGFPLTGAHASVACISCHAAGYNNTPSTCVSCHQSDYDGATNPNHIGANFPNTCQTCHTNVAWAPSTWDHDAQYFPIRSGTHANVWNTCATCHSTPSNYAVFECINCHQHAQATTDSHHSGVNNYQYLSTACYSCHPRGRS